MDQIDNHKKTIHTLREQKRHRFLTNKIRSVGSLIPGFSKKITLGRTCCHISKYMVSLCIFKNILEYEVRYLSSLTSLFTKPFTKTYFDSAFLFQNLEALLLIVSKIESDKVIVMNSIDSKKSSSNKETYDAILNLSNLVRNADVEERQATDEIYLSDSLVNGLSSQEIQTVKFLAKNSTNHSNKMSGLKTVNNVGYNTENIGCYDVLYRENKKSSFMYGVDYEHFKCVARESGEFTNGLDVDIRKDNKLACGSVHSLNNSSAEHILQKITLCDESSTVSLESTPRTPVNHRHILANQDNFNTPSTDLIGSAERPSLFAAQRLNIDDYSPKI